MTSYRISEVDGNDPDEANLIRHFNKMVLGWPPLSDAHLQGGYWWLIYSDFGFGRPIGFAGLVPFTPFLNVGYLKRCYVLPEHRGNGLQMRTMYLREAKAKRLGWVHLVSECTSVQSAGNFIKAGYSPCEPEQRWGEPGAMFFREGSMRVYVAGRMRGLPDLNMPAFAKAAQGLRVQGYEVYNPAAANLQGEPLAKIMAHVLPQLCECQAIAMLPRWWTRFGGAWIEWLLAKYLKIRVIYL